MSFKQVELRKGEKKMITSGVLITAIICVTIAVIVLCKEKK